MINVIKIKIHIQQSIYNGWHTKYKNVIYIEIENEQARARENECERGGKGVRKKKSDKTLPDRLVQRLHDVSKIIHDIIYMLWHRPASLKKSSSSVPPRFTVTLCCMLAHSNT